jgi:Fuc2NAc and GlcNAc transferase
MIAAALAFAVATGLTWAMIGIARRRTWLAMPNARSSHVAPTPTLGGIAIAVPVLGWAALNLASPLALAVLGSGGVLVLLGIADDLYELPAQLRLPLQVVAVLFALWQLPVPVVLALPPLVIAAPWAILVMAFLLLLWMINLYNFMDGIDGLAAAQCVCFCAATLLLGAADASAQLASIAGAAALGFLLFNWAPARIFMGDAASGLLGALCGSLALTLAAAQQLPLVASLILLAGFWFDASYTLCVRIVTGQQFAVAHRSHLYQIIARRIGHGRTTLMFIGYFCLWLTPLAAASVRWPSLTFGWLALAVLPLAVACVCLRSGLPETER